MKVRYRATRHRGEYEVWDGLRSRLCVVRKHEKRDTIRGRSFTVVYWVAVAVEGFSSVTDQGMEYTRRADVVGDVLDHLGRTDLTP